MSDPIMPHKYVESKTRFNAFMQPCCDVCGKMRDDYPELHNTYDPVESLREEVNRFKETNRFSPMTVTNFFVQAGLTIERLDQLKSTLTHYESALKEAKCLLSDCYRKLLWLRNDVDYEERNEHQRVIGPIDAINLQIKVLEDTINKVLGEK